MIRIGLVNGLQIEREEMAVRKSDEIRPEERQGEPAARTQAQRTWRSLSVVQAQVAVVTGTGFAFDPVLPSF